MHLCKLLRSHRGRECNDVRSQWMSGITPFLTCTKTRLHDLEYPNCRCSKTDWICEHNRSRYSYRSRNEVVGAEKLLWSTAMVSPVLSTPAHALRRRRPCQWPRPCEHHSYEGFVQRGAWEAAWRASHSGVIPVYLPVSPTASRSSSQRSTTHIIDCCGRPTLLVYEPATRK